MSAKRIICARCGRTKNEHDGPWLLCPDCATYQCPSCYGNPLESAGCPGCLRIEGKEIVEYLTLLKKETEESARLKTRNRSQKGS